DIPTNEVFISFDSKINEVTLRVIKEAAKNSHYIPVTFLDVKGIDIWCSKICPIIRRCAFMIADVSFWGAGEMLPKNFTNPNVAMEIGMGVALRKNIILVLKGEQLEGALYMSNLSGADFCTFGQDSEEFRRDLERRINEVTQLIMKQHVLSMAPAGLIENDLDLQEIHVKIEYMADRRLIVKNRFSVTTYTDELIELRKNHFAKNNNWGKKKTDRYGKALKDRVKTFIEGLELGKEHIDIYQIKDLEEYATEGKGLITGEIVQKQIRIQHFRNIIYLLDKYPNYKIYLTEANIGFTFTIGGPILVLPSRELQDEGQARAVITAVPSIVNEFNNQFNKIKNINQTKKNRDFVKRKFRKILNRLI
ncbi:MAG: hypothetical protein ACFFCW_47875, partial [Candidatus Hodarchaeota archaeon]